MKTIVTLTGIILLGGCGYRAYPVTGGVNKDGTCTVVYSDGVNKVGRSDLCDVLHIAFAKQIDAASRLAPETQDAGSSPDAGRR